MKRQLYTIAFILSGISLFAQTGVGINTGTSLADPSAILEVKSTTRGILIPRIALASRPLATAVPAGLMIYNTTDKEFNYSNGSAWISFPGAFITQIQDKDLDTYVNAEKTADEDILRFATGQSGSSKEVAQITKTGINLNYNAGSEYLYESNRVIALNNVSHTLASGAGSYPAIELSTLPNTLLGSNVMSTSSLTAGSNVVAGANAGNVLTSSNNIIVGCNASKSLISGNENTIIGTDAYKNSTAGKANTIIGKGAGAIATSDSLILIGKDAGSTLTSGHNNILIGTNVQATTPTSNNVIALGSEIKADASTKKVTFHNLYTFPDTAGAIGDLLILNATNELKWSGRISRQVAGVMADIKPFDAVMATSNIALAGNAYYMKLMSYATAELADIATTIFSNTSTAPATVELGIFNSSGTRIGFASATVPAGSVGDIKLSFATQVSVTSGQILYLAIYCSNGTDIKFPSISSSLIPASSFATATGLPISLPTPLTSNPSNIFINAY